VPAALPHPIPYQGSKRRLATRILAVAGSRRFGTLYEPFAGSAALTIAAAAAGTADRYVIGDSLRPLIGIWDRIVSDSDAFATEYAELWREQLVEGGPRHFNRIRAEFNRDGDAAKLLYLLARCVKNAPRFGRTGLFNQSPDHRRKGMNPAKMRRQIEGCGELLGGRAVAVAGDAHDCLASAGPEDLVYLDPPWQGTTEGPDTRYHQGFARRRLEALLADLNARAVPWILSYDGTSGARTYGDPLPLRLWAAHLELHAGRSSQATLVGREDRTIESLYVAPSLAFEQVA
jgi:DNA adenine methylase